MATTTAPSAPISNQTELPEEKRSKGLAPWTVWERFFFRVGALFVIQLIAPVRFQFYQRLVQIHTLRDVYFIPNGNFSWVSLTGESARWGIAGFANWGIALLIAIVLAGVWTWFARNSKRKEYVVADYWIRLFTRYWVALAILHYGYIKLYPVQMPFPSFANLHTAVGDTAPYRYYWAIVGLSTWYEIALGTVEVLCGTLLFFRRTLPFGTLLTLGVLLNVAYANFAYDGGVHILSAEIALLAGYLLVPYARDLYRLMVKKEDVVPNYYHPVFRAPWKNHAFMAIKIAAWTLFIPLYFYNNIHHYLYTNQSKEPRAPGLSNAKGYYSVTDFKLDGKDLPYSPLDSVRWYDVTFEDYPTLTFKVNKPLPVRLENGGQGIKDAEKTYELAGYSGGRTYLHYELNEANQTLTVQDKNANDATRNAGTEEARGGPALLDPLFKRTSATDNAGARDQHQQEGIKGRRGGRGGRSRPVQKQVWHYTRPTPSRIILTGHTFDGHEFYAQLDRVDENQAIHISSPTEGKPLEYGRQFSRRFPVTPVSFDGTIDTTNRMIGER